MPPTYWEALVTRQEGFTNFTPDLHAALSRVKVAVIGAGGNGAVLDLLARTGFCRFVIIDPDIVENTDLNRLPFGRGSIGLAKATAWKKHLESINPSCEIVVHERAVTRHDSAWLTLALRDVELLMLCSSDLEANVVAGRTAAKLGIRMTIGPASSGSCCVSTFTHDNGLDFETIARLGTKDTSLEDIDYISLRSAHLKASSFPGWRDNFHPQAWEELRAGLLPARSCVIFVRLINAAMAFEAVKNAAVLSGLPLERTDVVTMPLVRIFDPWSGCSYLFNTRTGNIGIPNWLTGDVHWEKAPEDYF